MDIWSVFIESYKSTIEDERTTEWLLVKYESIMYSMFAVYLYFVLRWGPKYMENRKPYDLKTYIKYYNILEIIYNFWIVYSSIQYGLITNIGFGCKEIDRSKDGIPMQTVDLFFWVYLLKIIDLSETVVFVLRKKQRQISFLHLYHHISTIYLIQQSTKYYPGGMALFPVALNSLVHVIMYTYYLLSSQGQDIQKYLNKFKPYITILQMIQFFILLAHSVQGFLPNCSIPIWGPMTMIVNLTINFVLFYNFYRKNYKKMEKSKMS